MNAIKRTVRYCIKIAPCTRINHVTFQHINLSVFQSQLRRHCVPCNRGNKQHRPSYRRDETSAGSVGCCLLWWLQQISHFSPSNFSLLFPSRSSFSTLHFSPQPAPLLPPSFPFHPCIGFFPWHLYMLRTFFRKSFPQFHASRLILSAGRSNG